MASTSKADALLKLIRFDKPIGTLLLLWPTLWALWLAASGVPDARLLAIFASSTIWPTAISTEASHAPGTALW
jgi:4-hydroxybenzoate polyprenyltransferase